MKIKGMLLFYVHRYLHSIYLILPLLLWFVFLTTNFAIAPQYFASAIGANALVLVLLMTWVAYAVNSIISDTALSIAVVQVSIMITDIPASIAALSFVSLPPTSPLFLVTITSAL